MGLRGDVDFLLWQACNTLVALQEMAIRLRSTGLGRCLHQPYSYLAMTKRSQCLDKHFRVGHKYPSVKINATYSFGLDDQEFVVAFATDSPAGFLDLVMDLRGIDASRYTLRATPVFTCIRRSLRETIDGLGG